MGCFAAPAGALGGLAGWVCRGRALAVSRYGTSVLRLPAAAFGAGGELELGQPGRLSVYVCGPTVYAEPHIGHGRFTLVWDIMRRYLTWAGIDVDFVSNVTDIDDKIIARAHDEGRPVSELTAEYEAVWFDTMARLGVRAPTETPHATAY